MFKKHDLREKLSLKQQQIADLEADMTVIEVYELLNQEYQSDQEALGRLKGGDHIPEPINARHLVPSRLFSEQAIRQLAVEYRLRFLYAQLFKGEIPNHAISSLRKLERTCGVKFHGAMILAPSEMFELENCEDDPLMFVRLGNHTWYLVDQWGGEISPWRKLKFFPYRNKATFALTVFTLAFFVATLFPLNQIIGDFSTVDLVNRLALFTWIFICSSAFIACAGLAWNHELSVDQWKSPYIKRSF